LTPACKLLIVMLTMNKKNLNNDKKRMNLIIILSSAGALLIFALIGLLAYLPGKMSTTDYDFLYTAGYSNHGMYFVNDGKLQLELTPKYEYVDPYEYEDDSSVLYRYDASTDTSSVISYEDARALTVDSKTESPDGYSVVMKYDSANYTPFSLSGTTDSRSGYKVFLHRGISNRSINVETGEYGGFQFIAWIIED
jgi:hypothetical protein